MRLVAISASVHLIASIISTLPLKTFERKGDRGVRVNNQPDLVDDPGGTNRGTSDWLYQYLYSQLVASNAFGQVTALDGNYPRSVSLYYPDDVSVRADPKTGTPLWSVRGNRVEDMWHQRMFPIPGVLLGVSPIIRHAASIGVGIAAERFGLQFFTDGGHPTGILTNDVDEIDGPKSRKVKDRWKEAIYGAREPVVMGRGWKYEQVQISPNESQFLETQKFSAAQCARIYGPNVPEVLGYETGGSMTYANVVERNNALLTQNLNTWMEPVEEVFNRMLPPRLFVKFQTGAFLRSTTLDRYRAHALALANRWKVVNEVRRDEDMEPVAWGNEPNQPTKVDLQEEKP